MHKNGKLSGSWEASALLLVFITLKLCGVIKWSWVWVLSPMWITAIIVLPLAAADIAIRRKYRKMEEKKDENQDDRI